MVDTGDKLRRIIMQLLITSDSRTTDLLEQITSDQLHAVVIRQVRLTERELLRESHLVTNGSGLYVSQNLVRIRTEYTPPELLHRVVEQKEGIGHVLRSDHIRHTRRMIDCGWRRVDEAVDLFERPYQLRFQHHQNVPYKEYEMLFPPWTSGGIHLLEYFNPDMIETNSNLMTL